MQTDTSSESPGWRFYLQEKVVVIFLLGFSAGLPFLLVYSTLSAWLKDAGLQMSTISTFAWLGFAYSLKFVWAPFIDSLPRPFLTRVLGRRRGWLLLAQLAIGGALAGLIVAGLVGIVFGNIPLAISGPFALFLDGNSFAFPLNPGNIAATLLILTAITVVSAYLPARKAARMRPADALRTSY